MYIAQDTATLYVKADSSVLIRIAEADGYFSLLVYGPAYQRMAHEGLHPFTIIERHAEITTALVAQGDTPNRVANDRRALWDRRQWLRRNARERRRP